MFNAAPRQKNGVVVPNQAFKYGNANAVTNEPILPAIFIVPDTAPVLLRPISTQSDQEGLNVMSAPKIANDNNITAPMAVLIYKLAINPTEARAKPMIAGTILDNLKLVRL